MTGLGGLLGVAFGCGLYLVIVGFGPVRARTFVLRVEHFWQSPRPSETSRVLARLGTSRLLRIEQRQKLAGQRADAASHLLSLAIWGAGGLLAGSAALAILTATGGVHQPSAALLLLLICVTSAVLMADRRLDTKARRRRERAIAELPGVAESLAIAVSAGASLPHAFALVAEQGSGVLSDELGAVVQAVRDGSPLDSALAALNSRMNMPVVDRFVEGLRIALERGTPIADVLHAQATDARTESRRALMELAGRREVAMLIPVVFLVLPSVVIVALYPGFRELTTMV